MSERAASPAASPAATVESPVAIAAPSPGQAGGPGIVCIRAPDGIVVTLQLAPGEIDRDMRRFSKISLTDEEGNSVVLETGSLYTSSHIPITDVGASTFACGYVVKESISNFHIYLGYLNAPFDATLVEFEMLVYADGALPVLEDCPSNYIPHTLEAIDVIIAKMDKYAGAYKTLKKAYKRDVDVMTIHHDAANADAPVLTHYRAFRDAAQEFLTHDEAKALDESKYDAACRQDRKIAKDQANEKKAKEKKDKEKKDKEKKDKEKKEKKNPVTRDAAIKKIRQPKEKAMELDNVKHKASYWEKQAGKEKAAKEQAIAAAEAAATQQRQRDREERRRSSDFFSEPQMRTMRDFIESSGAGHARPTSYAPSPRPVRRAPYAGGRAARSINCENCGNLNAADREQCGACRMWF